jgi:hypothetical protein
MAAFLYEAARVRSGEGSLVVRAVALTILR